MRKSDRCGDELQVPRRHVQVSVLTVIGLLLPPGWAGGLSGYQAVGDTAQGQTVSTVPPPSPAGPWVAAGGPWYSAPHLHPPVRQIFLIKA